MFFVWSEPASELNQASWIDELIDLLVAKPRVAGVSFPHFSDGLPHDFPNAGLLRADDTPKPVSERIKARQTHRRKF